MITSRQPMVRHTPTRRRLAAAAIVLLGFALRVHRIGEQRVWWDEGWSVWVARFSPLETLRQTGNDVHPPLYFELLHFWRGFGGDDEAVLRLLAAFLGTLTIAMTYALARRMARGTLASSTATLAALLAALLLTISRFAIAWSQEIRMYALASLLAVVAVLAARRVWARGSARHAAVYVLATAAGLYTLYLFAPVWAAINVAWLWAWRESANRRREFLRWAGLQLLVVALFLPWMWYAAGGFLNTAAATPISLVDFLHIFWTVLTVGIPVDVAQFNRLTIPAAALFLGAVAALVVSIWRGQPSPAGGSPASPVARHASYVARRDLTLLLAILLLPAIVVYIVSLPKQNFYNPPFNPRYLVIFTPFYSILLAWGLAAVGAWIGSRGAGERGSRGDKESDQWATNGGPITSRSVSSESETDRSVGSLVARRSSIVTSFGGRWSVGGGLIALGLSAFMLAVALVGLWPYYPGRVLADDYPSLVSTIDAYRQPGDAVLLYTDTDWPIFAYHHPDEWRGVPGAWTVTPELAADFLAEVWEQHEAIWLVTTPYSAAGDPQRHIPSWLRERATAVREFTYKDMALTLYTRTEDRAATANHLTGDVSGNLDVPLPGGSVLTGYDQAAHDFKSGDIIHLFLYLRGGEAGRTEVGLIDAASSNVWQPTAMEWPSGPVLSRQQVDIIVPPEAPSGAYRFYILDAAGQTAPFGGLTVRQRQTAFLTVDDVSITNRVEAQFGDAIRLHGYDLAKESARPGETIDLTLYWSADGDVRQRYKVFTHLLGDTFNAATGNFLWGQTDNEPAANTRPTTTWRGAEVIVDEYIIPVAPDAPPGNYRIELGLYDPVTGERLPFLGTDGVPAADHLILTDVIVE